MRFSGLKRWTMLTGLLVSTLFFINAVHAAGLNDTGITTCSNADTNGLPCPVADFPGQDAEFGSNGFDFTKLDAAGNDLPASATDHTCVRDNVTGLIWQVNISDSTYTFDETAGYVNNVNATGLCGFNDWRMPNPKELLGIADQSIVYPDPTIDTNYFPNTASDWFWSGFPYADNSYSAWYVHFGIGSANFNNRDNGYHVRLVRGGQSFDSFVNNEDGIVTQSSTGLMWAKCSEGQTGTNCTGDAITMNWSTALTAANNSNRGGYDDWRLPNTKELQALVDYSRYLPAIDTNYFPNTPSSWFWSSSPFPYVSNYALGVNFDDGDTNNANRHDSNNPVRLVRGGQSFDSFALTVNKTGSGAGVVKSGDGKINCGSNCSSDFESGSSIILTATPDTSSGSTFSGWSGACTNKTGTCTVTMSAAQTVTATFTATHAAGLNDTGITTCSNADTNGLPCPVADFPGQDAEFGSNGFDFTKLDAAGNDLPASATDHTCVRDNVTGLIWQVKISDSTFTFDQATGYVNNVNATGLCGFKDWRMPDIKELMGIADHGEILPAIDTNYFPNTPGDLFWSGSPDARDSDYAWSVYFGHVDANNGVIRDECHFVRLVRGGQSFNSFVDNEDGTVTQSNTGLMWAKCSEGQTGIGCVGDATAMDWSSALTAANNSRLGDHNDWRLPNAKELQALADYSRYSPAIDTSYFPNTPNLWFWSGSPDADYSVNVFPWYVDFYYGYASNDDRSNGNHVRLVRGALPNFFDLSVNKTGSGAGVVKSSDGKINCGSNCSSDFESGSSIILTATPDTSSGSIFSGWSGACTNKTGTCTVNMSAAQTVTANFNLLPSYKLSISKNGNGAVTSSPAGINCGTACSKQFTSGTAVTLTAKADTGGTFSKWTGCTPIATNPLQCTFTLTSNKTVTAAFNNGALGDLKITAIALTPASPAANSIFTAKITVKNQGTVTATGGYLDVWAHQTAVQTCGAQAEWIEIGSLAAGASKTLTVSLRSKGTGTKTLRAFVDSWCQTPEADETNNQLTKTYTVK
ncbi:DUF1566 domain-containing protein [Chromatium okenii]|nr:DUF1566 domain-containing protein [Chromatium okenii]